MAIFSRTNGSEYFIQTRRDACGRCDAPFKSDNLMYMHKRKALCELCARIVWTPEQFKYLQGEGVRIVCRGCQRTMIGFRFKAHYCTERCYQKVYQKVYRQRQIEDAICQECRISFEPSRADARFCSNACRQRSYRKRVTTNKNRRPVRAAGKVMLMRRQH